MSTRDKFIGVNSITFNKRFTEDGECYEYLSLIKWENGFVCRKCNYDKHCNGKKPFSKRCLRCKYDESPTTNTMLEKLKFPILIAFHIAFKISTKKIGMSSMELSNEFEIDPWEDALEQLENCSIEQLYWYYKDLSGDVKSKSELDIELRRPNVKGLDYLINLK